MVAWRQVSVTKMADYDLGQVALLVVGAVVAWEGFYMVFKSVAVGGASFHPIFSGGVGAVVGLVMFVVGGLIAYGTYLEIGTDDAAQTSQEDRRGDRQRSRGSERPAARAANTTVGEDAGEEPRERSGRDGPETDADRSRRGDGRPPDGDDRQTDPRDRPAGADDRARGRDDGSEAGEDVTRIRDDGTEPDDRGTEASAPPEDDADAEDEEAFVEDVDLSDVERE